MGRRPSIPPTSTTSPDTNAPLDPSYRPYKRADYFSATEGKRKKWRAAKQILMDAPEFLNLAAPPSLKPPVARYCDITGLVARYHDPKTGLWYHSATVYQYIRGLSPNAVQSILAIRNANVEI
jgi:INO80 complex subunit C